MKKHMIVAMMAVLLSSTAHAESFKLSNTKIWQAANGLAALESYKRIIKDGASEHEAAQKRDDADEASNPDLHEAKETARKLGILPVLPKPEATP
jgi:hypothetical protein